MIKTKRVIFVCLSIITFLLFVTSCDPVLPDESIEVVCSKNPVSVGESLDIQIIYPDTADTAIVEWTEPVIKVLQGEDVISINGMSVTGIKTGTATISVSVKGLCSFYGVIADAPEYVAVLDIVVE